MAIPSPPRLPWVSSLGGPLILIPDTALHQWQGSAGSNEVAESVDDYGRACQVKGHAGVIPAADTHALVLTDPCDTTYLPTHRLLVQWQAADSEEEFLAHIDRALAAARWEEQHTWSTTGPATLIDSALTENDAPERLSTRLEPGTYTVRTVYIELDNGPWYTLIQLTPHKPDTP